MGTQRIRTNLITESNGCVERWHRTLKSALTSHMDTSNWTNLLPYVL
uniref:Pol polyprotein n=1 Tax=Triatoma infestans TaxID=30076 RepID=A0A170Z4C1_TRIIF